MTRPTVQYVFNATVLEWHDGDTVKLDVDQGFEGARKSWFRLYGVDAQELKTPEGKVALAAVEGRWPVGTAMVVVSHKAASVPVGKEKYGRWLADLYPLDSDQSVSEWLKASALGVKYLGGKKGVAVP